MKSQILKFADPPKIKKLKKKHYFFFKYKNIYHSLGVKKWYEIIFLVDVTFTITFERIQILKN